jgi:hypothetical protein
MDLRDGGDKLARTLDNGSDDTVQGPYGTSKGLAIIAIKVLRAFEELPKFLDANPFKKGKAG